MGVSFLTPLGALLALGAAIPVVAMLGVRRRAGRLRTVLGVERARKRSLLVPLAALAGAATLLGLAAAQPILERTSNRELRTDAEVFVVVDVSRSMLAQAGEGASTRLERATSVAGVVRGRLSDARVGVATVTDRVLPHLFPSSNLDVFEATLERSIGIERPPPRSSFLTNATKLDSLAGVRTQRFFSADAKKRLVVVLTDGESQPVASARVGTLFRQEPAIDTIYVHVWGEGERVYSNGAPEPQYLPDPSSRALLERLAASTGGSVFGEENADAIVQRARQYLGSGPTVVEGQTSGRDALAPYLALAAFLPVGLLLWRRDR
jgi:hypothetical protein